jgi:protein SCO1
MKAGQSQLLSISIDPLSDDAAALFAWRRKYAAGALWLAASPASRHAQTMLDFLQARSKNRSDAHTAQTHLFDRQGRLAYTFAELASAADIAPVIAALLADQRSARGGY